VWRRLAQVAPVAPALVEALSRFDGLGLRELEAELARREEELRAWACRPENRGRPSHREPAHLERVALGILLERRTWWE
jgi:hypothetical protein